MRGRFRYVARCIRGHLFDAANTRITEEGWQVCRACDRDRKRKRSYACDDWGALWVTIRQVQFTPEDVSKGIVISP